MDECIETFIKLHGMDRQYIHGNERQWNGCDMDDEYWRYNGDISISWRFIKNEKVIYASYDERTKRVAAGEFSPEVQRWIEVSDAGLDLDSADLLSFTQGPEWSITAGMIERSLEDGRIQTLELADGCWLYLITREGKTTKYDYTERFEYSDVRAAIMHAEFDCN